MLTRRQSPKINCAYTLKTSIHSAYTNYFVCEKYCLVFTSIWTHGLIFLVFFITLTFQLSPFRTAVTFWGHITWKLSDLSPKRDCGSKGVRVDLNEECFSVFFSIFPKIWYFFLYLLFNGRNTEISGRNRKKYNTEISGKCWKKLKNTPR